MDSIRRHEWCVFVNPHAGGGKGEKDANKIKALLHQYRFKFSYVFSEYPGHILSLTQYHLARGYRNFIAVGGDGTLNELVNGIFAQKKVPVSDVLVAVIPVGTGNDWVKTFNIPNHYQKAIACIQNKSVIKQDVGSVRMKKGALHKNRYFVNMAGFGFDAMVAEKANKMKAKGRTGFIVYLYSLLAAYLGYRVRRIRFELNGKPIDDVFFSASIGIGKYNGGGMKQAPEAIPVDGRFQVNLIHKIGFFGILKNLRGLYNGSYVHDHRVESHVATHINISSVFPVSAELDGENMGKAEYFIKIIPCALNVVCGEGLSFVSSPNP